VRGGANRTIPGGGGRVALSLTPRRDTPTPWPRAPAPAQAPPPSFGTRLLVERVQQETRFVADDARALRRAAHTLRCIRGAEIVRHVRGCVRRVRARCRIAGDASGASKQGAARARGGEASERRACACERGETQPRARAVARQRSRAPRGEGDCGVETVRVLQLAHSGGHDGHRSPWRARRGGVEIAA
jgi:hypothetical protein